MTFLKPCTNRDSNKKITKYQNTYQVRGFIIGNIKNGNKQSLSFVISIIKIQSKQLLNICI